MPLYVADDSVTVPSAPVVPVRVVEPVTPLTVHTPVTDVDGDAAPD